jgi:hypothetical protein
MYAAAITRVLNMDAYIRHGDIRQYGRLIEESLGSIRSRTLLVMGLDIVGKAIRYLGVG